MHNAIADLIEEESPAMAAEAYARSIEATSGIVAIQRVVSCETQSYHELLARFQRMPFQATELGAAEHFVIEYEPASYIARRQSKPVTHFEHGRDMRTVEEIRQWESHDRRVVNLLEVIDRQQLEILQLRANAGRVPVVERRFSPIPLELLLIGEDED